MKQHFQPHVPERPVVLLSLEEEAIVMTELADSSGVIDADLIAVDRATDVAKGVEDVETIMGNINNVDDTCAALISAVGEMGVSGTDADPEEIMPDNVTPEMLEVATESEEGNKPNVITRLKETAKKIWDSIMQLLKAAWENIKKFFGSIFDYLQNCKAQIVDLKTKINHLSRVKEGASNKPISFNDPYHFILDAKGEGGGARMETNDRYMQTVFTDGARHVAKIGAVLNDSLKSFSTNNVATWETQTTSTVAALVQQLMSVLTAKKSGSNAEAGDDNKVLAHGAEVLGAWRMSVYGSDVAFSGEGSEQTEALAQIRFRPGPSSTSESSTIEFPAPFPLEVLKDLLNKSEKMVDHLFYLQRGDGARVLKNGVESIQRNGDEAIAKLGDKVSGGGDAVEDDSYAKAALNRVMRISSAYGNWANSPLKEVAHRSVMFVNMEINIVRKMMRYYE